MPKIHSGICRNPDCQRPYRGRGKHFCSTPCHTNYQKKYSLLADFKLKAEDITKNWDSYNLVRDMDFSKFIKIPYTDCIISGDYHMPFINKEFFERMLAVGIRYKIPAVVIAGDFLNQDQFSKYGNRNNGKYSFQDELDAAEECIVSLLRVFKKIYWISGNHDWRIIQSVDYATKYATLAKMIYTSENFIISDRSKMVIEKNAEIPALISDWTIVHPAKYSKIKNRVPQVMESKYRTNVVSFHEHVNSHAMNITSENHCYSIGMMADLKKLAYVHDKEADSSIMENGFLMIRGGYPYNFNNHIDWDFYL